MKTCYIIGAGDVSATSVKAGSDDLIICADGGYKHKNLLGREADLVVGDYDSLGYVPECDNKIVVPCEKDVTDMHLAVNAGLEKGCKNFVLFGALGGERAEHSVANIQLLKFICSKGGKGTAVHGKKIFTAFKNGEMHFSSDLKGYISLFSLCDESRGVTVKNLKYEIENFTLRNDFPLGVSNEFVGKDAAVSVEDGTLLVIYDET